MALQSALADYLRVNPEACEIRIFGRSADELEVTTEYRRQRKSYLVAKGCSDRFGSFEWHPVALGCESAAGDAVADVSKALVDVQDACGGRLGMSVIMQ